VVPALNCRVAPESSVVSEGEMDTSYDGSIVVVVFGAVVVAGVVVGAVVGVVVGAVVGVVVVVAGKAVVVTGAVVVESAVVVEGIESPKQNCPDCNTTSVNGGPVVHPPLPSSMHEGIVTFSNVRS
jgi:hypothetical protein